MFPPSEFVTGKIKAERPARRRFLQARIKNRTLLKPEPSFSQSHPHVSVPQKATLGRGGKREEKTLASFGAILVKRGVKNNPSSSHCISTPLHGIERGNSRGRAKRGAYGYFAALFMSCAVSLFHPKQGIWTKL